jgi:hypothetical protein
MEIGCPVKKFVLFLHFIGKPDWPDLFDSISLEAIEI